MKYVALLSGGKDSCFNLLHCEKNGHKLVAAASLCPQPGVEELDSYLYQTVGQDAIELVAQALDVPLFRRYISGNAIEQGLEYGSRAYRDDSGIEGDETEDLFAILSDVKSQHPEVQGVSVGAILSNYQRVRVEHVCRRLRLTPLSYLWNRDQGEILAEMINAGMEAILIKVAGIGLTVKHLGKKISEMHPILLNLNSLYGAHICGEGGEYESLTLDCPLFKHRIKLVEVENVIHSDNDFATVAFLRIKKAALQNKAPSVAYDLPVPSLLDEDFACCRDALVMSPKQDETAKIEILGSASMSEPPTKVADSRQLGAWVVVSNIEYIARRPERDITIEEEVMGCFQLLKVRLREFGLDIPDCTNINIFLSSINLFASVNAAYSKFFGSSPPARACVAVDLPSPVRVRLECTAFVQKASSDRYALHVQSLSYWAPANIGPYSQAIMAGERVFVSGQIGLIPSRLNLPSPRSLAFEMALASQHVSRIIGAVKKSSGTEWIGQIQLAIYWFADVHDLLSVKRLQIVGDQTCNPPTVYLVVKALPRDALVEKQVLAHTGRSIMLDEDKEGGSAMQLQQPVFKEHHVEFEDGAILAYEQSCFDKGTSACITISIKGGSSPLLLQGLRELASIHPLSSLPEQSLSARLFYAPSRDASYPDHAKIIFGDHESPPTTLVPCRFISSSVVDDCDYVLCINQSQQ